MEPALAGALPKDQSQRYGAIGMYDEIVRITEDQTNGTAGRPNLELLKTLPPYEKLREFERTLRDNNQLSFRRVFNEPVGFYLFKCFLV